MKKNENNQLEQFIDLEETIRELPIKQQKAIRWAIQSFGILKEICKETGMATDEIERMKPAALEKENYATFILLCMIKYMQETNRNEEI